MSEAVSLKETLWSGVDLSRAIVDCLEKQTLNLEKQTLKINELEKRIEVLEKEIKELGGKNESKKE